MDGVARRIPIAHQKLPLWATPALMLLAGCQFLPPGLGDADPTSVSKDTDANGSASDSASGDVSPQAALAASVLKRADWVHRVRLVEDTAGERQPRWRHAALEDLLSRPEGKRPKFARLLDDENPVVAANAAIALARVGSFADSERLADRLGEVVRHPQLSPAMRRAAAEALSEVEDSSAMSQLKSLVQQYGDSADRKAKTSLSGLYAELIGSLLQQGLDESDPLLLVALRSQDKQVRVATLRAWPRHGDRPLPREALDLADDNRPDVRRAALELIAARKAPQAMSILERALGDHYAQVRLAAVAGVGELGATESGRGDAVARLEKILESDDVKMRAAAVSALSALGARQQVVAAASDSAWQVRRVVAVALSEDTGRQSVAAARRLLDDQSSQVSQQMVSTLETWPLDKAGPVLLDALASPSYTIRKAAAAALAAQWPAARSLRADANPAERKERIDELGRQWQVEFEDVFEESGPATARAIQKPVSEAMLPKVADLLVKLESKDVRLRRQAAKTLADEYAEEPLSRLALERLVALTMAEGDTLVWQSVQRMLAEDAREPAIRLHYAGLSHPTAEVRRRACWLLAAHGDPGHQTALIVALGDRDAGVVCAATAALAECGSLENPLPLVRLLASRDAATRLAASRTLALLGFEQGDAALERLAHDADFNVRRQAAVAMGEVGQPSFTPVLLSLLDDRLGVRRAALRSLAQINDQDFATDGEGRTVGIDRQIAAWRRWYDARK